MNGEHWGIADAGALVEEVDRELGERRRVYPTLVSKGRLDPQAADYQINILAEIRRDLDVAFGPPPWVLKDPRFTWEAKRAAIVREIELRRRFYPDRIAKGRLTADQANHRIAQFQILDDLYWRELFGWPMPAENWLDAVRQHNSLRDEADRLAQPAML